MRLAAGVLLFVSVSGSLAAATDTETGVRLLSAQLPSGKTIAQTDCEQLCRVVGRVTLTHRADAVAILSAALTGGVKKDASHAPAKRSCECVTRLFRVAVHAAPTQSSALLDAASALCPECADELAAALRQGDDKNVVDDKNGPAHAAAADPATNNPTGLGNNDPAVDGDLSDRNYGGLGFGPGFPGSPGFVGSSPSGAIALPGSTPVPTTNVMNL